MAPRVLIVDDNAELLGLLSTVFEDAGYQVLRAQKGRSALEIAKAERPDAAIIDVLLPDIMGHEVAALLRSLEIPFVMMTGVFKGGRHATEALQKHGADSYFEKPFEIQRLVEKIASLVPPGAPAQPPPHHEDDDEDGLELDVDVEDEEESARDIELTGRVSVTEKGHISATLQGERIQLQPHTPPPALAQTPRPAPPRPPPPREATPTPGSATRMGPLKDNLPQLISAFYLAQETGELLLQRGAVRKLVHFERGAPVFAASNLSTDRFGHFLARIGKVPPEEFKAAMIVAERTRRRTGDVLIEMGFISESERMYYVAQQVKAIIYSLFAWEEGRWQLAFRQRALQEKLKLDLHPANLILRGVRKLYAPPRLQRLLPDDARPAPSQDSGYQLSDLDLSEWEARLLPRVDGTRTVGELLAQSDRSTQEVRGFLVGLLSLQLLSSGK